MPTACHETGREDVRRIRAEGLGFGVAITGSSDQIIETLAGFTAAGVTRVEIVPYPNTMDTLELLSPVLSALM